VQITGLQVCVPAAGSPAISSSGRGPSCMVRSYRLAWVHRSA